MSVQTSNPPTAADIAGWPAPNYIDPTTRVSMILGVESTFVVLVTVLFTVRMYSRIFIVRAVGLDDWFMLIAALLSVGTSIMIGTPSKLLFATLTHEGDLNPALVADSTAAGQMAMAGQLLFVLITMFMKISVLLTYLRVFPSKTNKWFCYGMIAYTTVWGISTFLLGLMQCLPVAAYWNPAKYPNAKCLSLKLIFWISGGFNILSDFLIFLWPANGLSKLHVSLKERVTLVVMFSLGTTICVAGVCRLWYTSVYLASYDVLWEGSVLYIIITIETGIGIICGCIPACRPVLRMFLPKLFATKQGSAPPKSFKTGSKASSGQKTFPFESLDGDSAVTEPSSIVKSQTFNIRYSESMGGKGAKADGSRGKSMRNTLSDSGSDEWIMLRDDLSAEETCTDVHAV